MGKQRKNNITYRAMGEELGISAAMVTKLTKQGMPMTSVEAAKQWREANRKNLPQPKAGVIIHLEEADFDSIDINAPQFSNEQSLKRALFAEERAGALLNEATKAGNVGLVRQLVQVQTDAAKARTAAKAAFLELEEREGNLMHKEVIIKRDLALYGLISGLLDALPDAVAASLNIEDPEEIKRAVLNAVNSVKERVAKRAETLNLKGDE